MDTFELLPSLAQGDLRATSAAELVAAIFRARASGTLSIEGTDTGEIRTFFRAGDMCGTGRFAGFHTLAHVLLANEWVDAVAIDESREESARTGKKHGEVLVANALLTPDQLRAALLSQHTQNLVALLARTEGTYEWQGWEPPPSWAREISVDPIFAIAEAMARHELAPRRRRVIEWVGAHGVRLSGEWAELEPRALLSTEQKRALAALNAPRPIPEFVRRSGMSKERSESLVAALLLCGGLDAGEPTGEQPSHPGVASRPSEPAGRTGFAMEIELDLPTIVEPLQLDLEGAGAAGFEPVTEHTNEVSFGPEATNETEPELEPVTEVQGGAGAPAPAPARVPPAPVPTPGRVSPVPMSARVPPAPVPTPGRVSPLPTSTRMPPPPVPTPGRVSPVPTSARMPPPPVPTPGRVSPVPTPARGVPPVLTPAQVPVQRDVVEPSAPDPQADEGGRELRRRMRERGMRNLGMAPSREVEGGTRTPTPAQNTPVNPHSMDAEARGFMDEVRARAGRLAKANAYERLGISPSATQDHIRQAYITAVKRFHPDRVAGNAALAAVLPQLQALFAGLKEAHDHIATPEARKQYDARIRAGSGGTKSAESRKEEAALALKMGDVFFKKRDFEAAIVKLRRAVELDPNGDSLAALSWALTNDPKSTPAAKEEALSLIQRALRTEGLTARTYYVAGVLFRTKDPPGSADAFRKALELDPTHAEASLELRVLEMRHGRTTPKGTGVLSGIFGKRKS